MRCQTTGSTLCGVNFPKKKIGQPQKWKPNYLVEDDDRMGDYFDPADKSGRYARRRYFAGPISV
jgi:hypothetical protein